MLTHEWNPLDNIDQAKYSPAFSDNLEYRIKPKPEYTTPVWRYIYKAGPVYRMGITSRPLGGHRTELTWMDDPNGYGYSIEV